MGTGLSYQGARYYDPALGRFLSQDQYFWDMPLVSLFDPQQQNSYSYARNNPLVYTDPDGKGIVSDLGNAVKDAYKAAVAFFQGNRASQSTSPSVNACSVPAPTTQVSAPTPSNHTWDPKTDDMIRQLDPTVQQPATNFINNTESQQNTQLRVVQGYRSTEEQDKLYEQGRTTPGSIVTNAKGGDSYHNYGMAIDVVVMEKGQPNWNKPITPQVADVGKQQGFEWGGDWTTFKDTPHFQMTSGQSTADLKKKKGK